MAVLSAGLVAGCSAPVVCPAIGYSNTLAVELSGETGGVAMMQLCFEDVCTDPSPPRPGTGSPGTAAPGIELIDWSGASVARIDQDFWKIRLDTFSIDGVNSTPGQVTVRALDADGANLGEAEYQLEWVRVGGSEVCGGPHEAGPVSLAIEA